MTDLEIVANLLQIEHRQMLFQGELGVEIYQGDFEQKKYLTEFYILHLIKEAAEVSNTIPSFFNKYEKNPRIYTAEEFKKEMADVFLHWVNLMNLHGIGWTDMIRAIMAVQDNNFKKLEEKKNAIT